MPTKLCSILGRQVYLAQAEEEIEFAGTFRLFRPEHVFHYVPRGDDFGPLNFSSVVDFIRALDRELVDHPDVQIVLCIDEGARVLTNAVFLLGAYMILKLAIPPAKVIENFAEVDSQQLVPYRDASFLKPNFELTLIDCWRGLDRSRQHGWVRYSPADYMWGAIDVDEYRHYDDPANGDVHQLIPGELIALPSPENLAGADFCDHPDGRRAFSPAYMSEILRDMGVATLVRLGAKQYDAGAMAARGIRVVDIACPDDGRPPDAAVEAFLREMDAAPGAVAVHCATGRGATGALAALQLMRSHGFTAREAMGWLQIVRPGSVVGEQQRFLCDVGAALVRLRRRSGRGDSEPAHGDAARPGRRRGLEPVREAGPESDSEDSGRCPGSRGTVSGPAGS